MPDSRRLFLTACGAAGAGLTQSFPAPAQQRAEPLDSEKFRAAVLAGDLTAVRSYLDRDPALMYARDQRGNSVYVVACLAGRKAVAEELEKRGLVLDVFEASAGGDQKRLQEILTAAPGLVDARSPEGKTPLHYAAGAGQLATLTVLQNSGANLSAAPASPMMEAIFSAVDALTLVEIGGRLVGNGSNPNAAREDGATLLHAAAQKENGPLTEFLLRKGADPSARDKQGRTPRDVAGGDAARVLSGPAIARDHYSARYLRDLKGNRIERDDTFGLPWALVNRFTTVAHANLDEVRKLTKLCPALVQTRATWDEMAVEAGAHMGRRDIADHLAGLGAPISACTATMMGEAGILRALLDDDPRRVGERGAHDFTILMFAAFGRQQLEAADILLRAGADPNARMGGSGSTAMHVTAGVGHVDLAKLFLESGADVNAKSFRGQTPLDSARRANQPKMVEFLQQRGAAG